MVDEMKWGWYFAVLALLLGALALVESRTTIVFYAFGDWGSWRLVWGPDR